jgi:hypothetical protein
LRAKLKIYRRFAALEIAALPLKNILDNMSTSQGSKSLTIINIAG